MCYLSESVILLFPCSLFHIHCTLFLLGTPGTLASFQFQDPLCCHLPQDFCMLSPWAWRNSLPLAFSKSVSSPHLVSFFVLWELPPWIEADLKADPWPKQLTYLKLVSLEAFPDVILSHLSLVVSPLEGRICGYDVIAYLSFYLVFYFLFLHLYGIPREGRSLHWLIQRCFIVSREQMTLASGISSSYRTAGG